MLLPAVGHADSALAKTLATPYCYSTVGRTIVHASGSLEDIVSNLVKNWEKEVSYKTQVEDFRTIDVKYACHLTALHC